MVGPRSWASPWFSFLLLPLLDIVAPLISSRLAPTVGTPLLLTLLLRFVRIGGIAKPTLPLLLVLTFDLSPRLPAFFLTIVANFRLSLLPSFLSCFVRAGVINLPLPLLHSAPTFIVTSRIPLTSSTIFMRLVVPTPRLFFAFQPVCICLAILHQLKALMHPTYELTQVLQHFRNLPAAPPLLPLTRTSVASCGSIKVPTHSPIFEAPHLAPILPLWCDSIKQQYNQYVSTLTRIPFSAQGQQGSHHVISKNSKDLYE